MGVKFIFGLPAVYTILVIGWPPPNGYYSRVDLRLVVKCNESYRLHHNIFCNSYGNWSHDPQCLANNIKNIEPPFSSKASLISCPPPDYQYDAIHWEYLNSTIMECPGREYCKIPPSHVSWSYGAQLRRVCPGGEESQAVFPCLIFFPWRLDFQT